MNNKRIFVNNSFKAKDKNSNYQSLLIGLAPIAGIYKLGKINVSTADAIFALLLAIFILNKCIVNKKVVLGKPLFRYFLIYAFIISILNLLINDDFYLGDYINKWIKVLVYNIFVAFYLKDKTINYNTIKRIIVYFAVVASIVLIIQNFSIFVLKKYIFPYISFIDIYYNEPLGEMMIQWQEMMSKEIYRASSFFAEPADYANFCLLPLILILFSNSQSEVKFSEKVFGAILISGIILSRSATGIFALSVIVIIWIFDNKGFRMSKLKLLSICIILILSIVMFFKTDFFREAVLRVKSINVASGMTTANLRFLQGIAVYSQMPLLNKIFGIGIGNLRYFLVSNQVVTPYLADIGNEYMNAFSTILVSTGIIGIILYMTAWWKMWISCKTKLQKCTILVLTMLFLTSSIFYSNISILYFLFSRKQIVKQ